MAWVTWDMILISDSLVITTRNGVIGTSITALITTITQCTQYRGIPGAAATGVVVKRVRAIQAKARRGPHITQLFRPAHNAQEPDIRVNHRAQAATSPQAVIITGLHPAIMVRGQHQHLHIAVQAVQVRRMLLVADNQVPQEEKDNYQRIEVCI